MKQRRAERAAPVERKVEAPVERHDHSFSPAVRCRDDGSWPPYERVMLCECGETDRMKPELYFRAEDVDRFLGK